MEKVIFINSKGQSIQLGNDGPYVLTKIEGTGAVNANIQSQKSPYQDGVTYLGNTLEARSIPIEIMILGENGSDIAIKRNKLLQIFNPKLDQGRLIYEFGNIKREIKAISELAPVFPHAGTFNDTMQEGLIQLYCPDPFFKDVVETKEETAVWRGAFEFPLELVEEGIEMGYREPSLIVNIFNQGDVPCGMKIQFKALATAVNPLLFNVNTREYFKINKTMTAGEIITVTTHFQNKRVELNKNGVISNAFQYIRDYNITFLQLDVGDNLLRYDADEGIDNLEVTIHYTPQYLGV
ncbi:phage tail family protein [Tissierella carlieri]|uniref:Phage tail family protein n=1 Tax=Tissierella carlieri TaxID=689904 RepID=A0ABT1S520_9FIRM|nr:phage tail family protein [Tissierella carlieri]MCQ4921565.1 phage tail family protein [Tissierella carlieri]